MPTGARQLIKTNQVPGRRRRKEWVPHFSVPTPDFPTFHRNLEEFTNGSKQTRDSPHSALGERGGGGGHLLPWGKPSPGLGPPPPALGHAARQLQKGHREIFSTPSLCPRLFPLCFSLLALPICGHRKNPWPFSGSPDRDWPPWPSGAAIVSPAKGSSPMSTHTMWDFQQLPSPPAQEKGRGDCS